MLSQTLIVENMKSTAAQSLPELLSKIKHFSSARGELFLID